MKTTFFTLVLLIGIGCGQEAFAQRTARPTRPPKPSSTATGPSPIDSMNRFKVVLLARSYGDSVVLRWAPTNALLFRAAVRGGGYRLTRRSLGPDKTLKQDFQVNIAPWTLDEWKQKVGPRDTVAGVCVQLLYGKSSVLKVNEAVTLDKLIQQKTQDDLRLMIGLTLADANARHADGMGLRFVDKNVRKGEVYFYSLFPLANANDYPTMTEKETVINTGPEARPAMVAVQAESGERIVRLRWDRFSTQEQFSAYYIERSADGGRTFRRLNRRPWLQSAAGQFTKSVDYTDSVAQNYKPYQYRVIGITPFAELSQPSPVLTAQGVDKTPPGAVSSVRVQHRQGTQVQISWQYGVAPGDLAGFAIGRGSTVSGPFTPVTQSLVSPKATSFVDENADPYATTYYVVVSIDTARNAASTPPALCVFKDVQGPTKPKNLQGYIDTTGFVRVVWDPNTDRDIMGYTVLFANDPTHIFTPVTAGFLPVSVFDDRTTLRTLTRKIYYRVVAWDQNHNPSPPSDILMLTRPDKLPPASPALEAYAASDTAIRLTWRVSASNDIREQLVLRRNEPTERWREYAKLPAAQFTFTDVVIKTNTAYQYAIVAVDSAGLRSPESFPLRVKTPTAYPRSANQLHGQLGPNGKTIVLNWKHPDQYARFIIYRASESGALRSYGSVNREQTFIDKTVQKGRYEYAVKVIYQDGRESGLSNRVKIDVN